MNKAWIAGGLATVAAGLAYWSMTAQSAELLPYRDAAVTKKGMQLYLDNCAACHGKNLEGEANWRERDSDGYLPAPPHDTTGHTWHHPDRQLVEITRLGTEAIVGGGYKSRMQGFGDILTEEEIVAILAFIKSTWPQRVIDAHNEVNVNAGG